MTAGSVTRGCVACDAKILVLIEEWKNINAMSGKIERCDAHDDERADAVPWRI
jgi:hypothetical protein